MLDSPINTGKITIEELKGLNEREQHAQSDPGMFDVLRGALPTNKNTLTKANGCKLHIDFGEPILNICQTFDARRNVIVQTPSAIRLITEEQLFGLAPFAPDITIETVSEEEDMALAIIAHQTTSDSVGGGSYSVANEWQRAQLNTIVSQTNPDGTAASFVTLVGDGYGFTLAAGNYRIRGWSRMYAFGSPNAFAVARLYNVTDDVPAWNGLANETGEAAPLGTEGAKLTFGGAITIDSPKTFNVQGLMQVTYSSEGFGIVSPPGLRTYVPNQIHRWLEILKTDA